MSWNDGYVSDIVYTSNFHREATPGWLAAAALLLGHRPPDMERMFRYADLGCGHGLTANVVAAVHPQAEVWGFDFNPAHVESARELARRAGLTNVRFEETSFKDLAATPAPALPAFDYVVAHGVISWVSRENRQLLVDVVGQRLKPGGLAYLSYNVATGWGAMPPVQALMRLLMLSANRRTDRSASGVLDYLDRIEKAGADFFSVNHGLRDTLADIRKQTPSYIAHEFLNQDWHPLMFADVAGPLAAAKCAYIGSASLEENVDTVSVPQGMIGLIAENPDPQLRETLRDFARAQAFRRDIYRRGLLPLTPAEHRRSVDALPLIWSGRPMVDTPSQPISAESLARLPDVTSLKAKLSARACGIAEFLDDPGCAARPLDERLRAVMFLMSEGYLHPALPSAEQAIVRHRTDRLNRAIADMAAEGAAIGYLAAPVIGSALPVTLNEMLLLREKAQDGSMDVSKLTERLTTFCQAEQSVPPHGRMAADAGDARKALRETIVAALRDRLPELKRLGVGLS